MSQKNKRRGKNSKSRVEGHKRDILFAEDGQLYATVEKMLGNCRLSAKCSDGKTRICHIRGKLKKRVWIREDCVILIGMRDFEDDKADVIHCYFPEEVRKLKAYKELPDNHGDGKTYDGNTEITWDADGGINDEVVNGDQDDTVGDVFSDKEQQEVIMDDKEIEDL